MHVGCFGALLCYKFINTLQMTSKVDGANKHNNRKTAWRVCVSLYNSMRKSSKLFDINFDVNNCAEQRAHWTFIFGRIFLH